MHTNLAKSEHYEILIILIWYFLESENKMESKSREYNPFAPNDLEPDDYNDEDNIIELYAGPLYDTEFQIPYTFIYFSL